MSTRDLIDAIESGNSSAIQQHFQDAIMSRVAERLDTMRIETAKNMFKSPVNEAVINTSDYHATSEKSQFGGFRPLVKHKDTGDTMYLSQHSYKTPDDAKGHADEYLKDEQEIDLAGFHIRVFLTPGHTVGGCCYYFPYQNTLFSGDSLFQTSIGRTDFPKGSASQLIHAIREKLMPLPDETAVYTGHGDMTTIGTERMYNPYL